MKKTILAAALFAALAGGAQAALVTVPFTYRVDFIDPTISSAVGLANGSLFSGSATYDDATAPVDGLYGVTALSLTLGNYSFNETSDISGLGVGLGATGNQFSSLYFTTLFNVTTGSGTGEYLLDFAGLQGVATPSGLTTDFKMSVSAVPLPAALPLMLAGLGVLGVTGRRRAVKA